MSVFERTSTGPTTHGPGARSKTTRRAPESSAACTCLVASAESHPKSDTLTVDAGAARLASATALEHGAAFDLGHTAAKTKCLKPTSTFTFGRIAAFDLGHADAKTEEGNNTNNNKKQHIMAKADTTSAAKRRFTTLDGDVFTRARPFSSHFFSANYIKNTPIVHYRPVPRNFRIEFSFMV